MPAFQEKRVPHRPKPRQPIGGLIHSQVTTKIPLAVNSNSFQTNFLNAIKDRFKQNKIKLETEIYDQSYYQTNFSEPMTTTTTTRVPTFTPFPAVPNKRLHFPVLEAVPTPRPALTPIPAVPEKTRTPKILTDSKSRDFTPRFSNFPSKPSLEFIPALEARPRIETGSQQQNREGETRRKLREQLLGTLGHPAGDMTENAGNLFIESIKNAQSTRLGIEAVEKSQFGQRLVKPTESTMRGSVLTTIRSTTDRAKVLQLLQHLLGKAPTK